MAPVWIPCRVSPNTANNCSTGVSVTVSDGMDPSYTVLDRWWLFPNGLVNFVAVTIGSGDCVNVNGSTLNGVTYTVHSTKWQRRDSAALVVGGCAQYGTARQSVLLQTHHSRRISNGGGHHEGGNTGLLFQ